MNILCTASEVAPLYKVGGLGDVVGSLPLALNKLGHDIRLAIPKYYQIDTTTNQWKESARFTVEFDGMPKLITVFAGWLPSAPVKVYAFAEPTLISAQTTMQQEAEKYALFSLAVSHWVATQYSGWNPHVIHLHDWHTALIPAILKYRYKYEETPTLLTIHNLNYQGITTTSIVNKLHIIPQNNDPLMWDGHDGDIDILLQGIIHADYVNTVSPTYAQEILTPEYGSGLEGILNRRRGRLVGILNGIDVQVWNPETDTKTHMQYDKNSWEQNRAKNRAALQEEVGLELNPDKIMLGFVGRVDGQQKGIELITQAIINGDLPKNDQQFIFLGVGDTSLEKQLQELSHNRHNYIALIKYDDEMAHKIYSSAHFMLIPSRYEPCGLVQMMAMRYGAIPIARKTGGLADTVIHNTTGIIFEEYTEEAFASAIVEGMMLTQNPTQYQQMVTTCMKQDFSWTTTAEEYVTLYNKLLNIC